MKKAPKIVIDSTIPADPAERAKYFLDRNIVKQPVRPIIIREFRKGSFSYSQVRKSYYSHVANIVSCSEAKHRPERALGWITKMAELAEKATGFGLIVRKNHIVVAAVRIAKDAEGAIDATLFGILEAEDKTAIWQELESLSEALGIKISKRWEYDFIEGA